MKKIYWKFWSKFSSTKKREREKKGKNHWFHSWSVYWSKETGFKRKSQRGRDQ